MFRFHPEEGFLHVILEFGTQLFETDKVGIQSTASDLVSPWCGDVAFAEACERWTNYHHASTQPTAKLLEFGPQEELDINGFGGEAERTLAQFLHHHAHVPQQVDQLVHVHDVRHVMDRDRLCGEQHSAEYLQRLVLGALRNHFALQATTSFDLETSHCERRSLRRRCL